MIASDVRQCATAQDLDSFVSSALIEIARRIDLLSSHVERTLSDSHVDERQASPYDPGGRGEELLEGGPVSDGDGGDSPAQRLQRRALRALQQATTAKPKVARKRRKKRVRRKK